MAKKAVSKIKIKSTGKTYVIRPDGYDELYKKVCILCDYYGVSRPDITSSSASTSVESQIIPSSSESSQSSSKPSKGPKLGCWWGSGSSAYKYDPSKGKLRIYDNGFFRFVNGDDDNQDEAITPESRIIGTDGGYQEPEVRYLPADVTITKVKVGDVEYPFNNYENIMEDTSDSLLTHDYKVVTHSYATVPTDELFAEYGYHSFLIYYTDNYSQQSTLARPAVHTLFAYNFADGHLRIYDNGQYRFVPYSELNGESVETPRLQGTFFQSINLEKFSYISLDSTKTFNFEGQEDVYEVNGEEPVNHQYITVTPSDFKGSFWTRYLALRYTDSSYYASEIYVLPCDTRLDIYFKVNEITLDRTDPNTIRTQIKNQLGSTFTDNLAELIDINIGEGIDYLGDVDEETIKNQIKESLYFSIGGYSGGRTSYRGDNITVSQVSSNNGEYWEIYACNWIKDAVEYINVTYRGHTYENSRLAVRMVDRKKPGQIYVRKMEVGIKTLYVNEIYTLRDLVKIIPSDGLFSDFQIIHDGIQGSVLDGTMDFFFKGADDAYITTMSERIPTNWDEFYDDFVTIKPIKAGQLRIYYLWRTSSGGGGGNVWMNVKNP